MSGRAFRRGGALLAALGLLWLTGCCCTYYNHLACGNHRHHVMTLEEREVRDATNRFIFALDRMLVGDLFPMSEVWSHNDDIVLMSAYGGTQAGWKNVRAQLLRSSKMGLSGRATYEGLVVRVAPDCETAWTAGRLVGDQTTRNGLPVTLELRATSVWRREGGHWKLVHLHLDPIPNVAATTAPVPEAEIRGRVE